MESLQALAGFVVNIELLSSYGWRILLGLKMTAVVVSLSVSIRFVLAFPLCAARLSRNPVISWAALAYVTFFRGTPLLCQLYLVYYGGGELRAEIDALGLWWFFRDAYYCCILAFSLNTAAYQSEIIRGAVRAIPKGQIEAARALGLSRLRIFRHVVLPQAALIALRPLGNELISMIKASALAAIVTLLDLMGQTRFIFARTFDFSVYLYCAAIYLVLTEAVRRAVNRIERALSRHLPVRATPARAAARPRPAPSAIA